MYDVIAIFPKRLSKRDFKFVKDLTSTKTITPIERDLSDILEFCQIGLGIEISGDVAAYELIQCDALGGLFLSPLQPFFCVRKGEFILDTTSWLGQRLVAANHVLRLLTIVQNQAQQAQKLREQLQLPTDDAAIDMIANELFPRFEREFEELVNYSRVFYARQAHKED